MKAVLRYHIMIVVDEDAEEITAVPKILAEADENDAVTDIVKIEVLENTTLEDLGH